MRSISRTPPIDSASRTTDWTQSTEAGKGKLIMTELEERIVIYIGLAVVCAFIGVFAGLLAAGLTYLQIAAVIEAIYWFGYRDPRPCGIASSASCSTVNVKYRTYLRGARP